MPSSKSVPWMILVDIVELSVCDDENENLFVPWMILVDIFVCGDNENQNIASNARHRQASLFLV
jgi:hypothetical protein